MKYLLSAKRKPSRYYLPSVLILLGVMILPSLSLGQQMVVPTVLRSPIGMLSSFASPSKIGDAGTFTVQKAGSIIEVTFNGRINVGSLSADSDGAGFELRIDDTPSTHGQAGAVFWRVADKPSPCCGIPASIKGIFSGLTPGNHTVSFWVGAIFGSGTNASVAPFGTRGQVVILEHMSLSTGSFLPLIQK